MSNRPYRFPALAAAALGAALLLGGCTGVRDFLGDIFTATHKSNLRGLRVSLLTQCHMRVPAPTWTGASDTR